MIAVNNVTFGYGAFNVLDGVSFAVRQGEFVALIGANGSGKSTLLQILLGTLAPFSGTVDICAKREEIGYVAQRGFSGKAGFPATVHELVSLSAQPKWFARAGKKIIDNALDQMEMRTYAHTLIGKLSGGQQQRAAIACALVRSPKLLLLDEPSTGLDPSSATKLFARLSALRQSGLTILAVTHDLVRAARYADRALCLEEGTLVELGPQDLAHELEGKHKHHKGSA